MSIYTPPNHLNTFIAYTPPKLYPKKVSDLKRFILRFLFLSLFVG